MSERLWLKSMKFFQMTCHQKPSRSFYFKNYQMPVCARCQGLYIGYLIGLISALFYQIPLIFAILMIIPCGLDGYIQLKSQYESTNQRRLIFGIVAGIAYIHLFAFLIRLIF